MPRMYSLVVVVFGLVFQALAAPIPMRREIPSVKRQHQHGRVRLGWTGLQNDTTLTPDASQDGDLGKAFYVADDTDLAKTFAANGTHICEVTADATVWSAIPKNWVSASQLPTNSSSGTPPPDGTTAPPTTTTADQQNPTGTSQPTPDGGSTPTNQTVQAPAIPVNGTADSGNANANNTGNSTQPLFPASVLFAAYTASNVTQDPSGLPKDTKPYQLAIRGSELAGLDIQGNCFSKDSSGAKSGQKVDYVAMAKYWNIQGNPDGAASNNGTGTGNQTASTQ